MAIKIAQRGAIREASRSEDLIDDVTSDPFSPLRDFFVSQRHFFVSIRDGPPNYHHNRCPFPISHLFPSSFFLPPPSVYTTLVHQGSEVQQRIVAGSVLLLLLQQSRLSTEELSSKDRTWLLLTPTLRRSHPPTGVSLVALAL